MKKCPICDLAEALNIIIEAGYEDTDVSLEELDEAKKVFIKAFSFLTKKVINEAKEYEN